MMKILCAGDLHLGRRPGGLPDSIDAATVSPAAVWADLVETAIDRQIDLVLLSGDLIDQSNRFFEAFGPLETGLRQLTAAGVKTLAVAGNHDYETLPRFSRHLKGAAEAIDFRLVGEGGRWERVSVHLHGQTVHIDGWSFPSEHYAEDPLQWYASAAFARDEAGPVIGLLHADLDQSQSVYAPVSAAALRRERPDFWLLGHIHKPFFDAPSGTQPILYPGSLQALDPSETGVHGAWIVELGTHGIESVTHVPLARLRYETVTVDVDGARTIDEVESRLIASVREQLAAARAACSPYLRYAVFRVAAEGASPVYREIDAWVPGMVDLELTDGDVRCLITRFTSNVRPDRNLAEIAAGSGAPAILARLILSVSGERPKEPEADRLLHEARARLLEVQGKSTFTGLHPSKRIIGADPQAHDDRIVALLRERALRLLDEMLAQKEERVG